MNTQLITVNRHSDLVAAVPALVGFHPRESVVILVLRGKRVGLTVRLDAPAADHASDVANQLPATLKRAMPDLTGVRMVVVSTRRRPHLDTVFRTAMARHQIEVASSVWATSTEAGGTWRCFEGCCVGDVPDHRSSVAAAAAAFHGMPMLPSREELARTLEPLDAVVVARRQTLADQTARPSTPDEVAAAVDLVTRAVAMVGQPEHDDAQVVALSVALAHPVVRDQALAMLLSEQAREAESLFTMLTCNAPGHYAADPAVLVAIAAHLRGDGALANVALKRAKGANSAHPLANLIEQLLANGMPPTDLRTLLAEVYTPST